MGREVFDISFLVHYRCVVCDGGARWMSLLSSIDNSDTVSSMPNSILRAG
jgi:hypothetical protein